MSDARADQATSMKDQVVNLIEQSIRAIQAEGMLPEGELPTPQVDHTRDPKHGDLATNAAMVLAKKAGMPPRDLATTYFVYFVYISLTILVNWVEN